MQAALFAMRSKDSSCPFVTRQRLLTESAGFSMMATYGKRCLPMHWFGPRSSRWRNTENGFSALSQLEKCRGDCTQMHQPNILHIMQCANLGGMEKSTLEMMITARTLGCNNQLISLNPIGGLGSLLKERGIPARGLYYRGPAGVLSLREMARAFREGVSPDGIVMTGHNVSAFAALAGHKCKKRILFVHFHHEGVMPRWQWQIVYAAAMRVFPRIAFCADFI